MTNSHLIQSWPSLYKKSNHICHIKYGFKYKSLSDPSRSNQCREGHSSQFVYYNFCLISSASVALRKVQGETGSMVHGRHVTMDRVCGRHVTMDRAMACTVTMVQGMLVLWTSTTRVVVTLFTCMWVSGTIGSEGSL